MEKSLYECMSIMVNLYLSKMMNENGASTKTTEGLWVFGSTILHECAAVVTFKCADYIWCIIPVMETFLTNLFFDIIFLVYLLNRLLSFTFWDCFGTNLGSLTD